MAMARGYKSKVVMDFESSFLNDPSTPAGIIIPINSFGLKGSRAKNSAKTLTGRRDPVAPFDGNVDVKGGATVPVDGVVFGYWLKAMFGAPTSTDDGSGNYTHVWKVVDTQPSLIFDKEFDNGVYVKYSGCKINSFSIKFGGDGELTADLDVIGAKEEINSAPYMSSPDEVALSRFSNFQATIKEDGNVLGNVTSGELSVNFNLDDSIYIVGGGGIRGDLPEGLLDISGSIKVLFENATYLNKALSSQESSLEFVLDNGNEKLSFILPELQYQMSTPGIDGPQGIMLDLPFKAYYNDNTDNTSIKIVLENTHQTY